MHSWKQTTIIKEVDLLVERHALRQPATLQAPCRFTADGELLMASGDAILTESAWAGLPGVHTMPSGPQPL